MMNTFFWTIQIAVFSFIFIYISHTLFLFFRDNLTTPKIKDFVNTPQQSYQSIFSGLTHQPPLSQPQPEPSINHDIDMKNELKNFLQLSSQQPYF